MSSYRFIRALQGQTVDRTPVWLMRQAGRYLPEYRALRAQAGDFLTLCKSPEFACEVTLQPLARFDLDAAIIFSDILVVPEAMGMSLSFVAGEGPVLSNPIQSAADVERLSVDSVPEKLAYVSEAIKLTKSELDNRVPLIGFAGSPWTVATYMVGGGSSKDFRAIKRMMYGDPAILHQLLAKLTKTTIAYLCEQAKQGADALMVFDTWGGILPTPQYQAFSLAYMTEIIKACKQAHPDIPLIMFTKQGGQWLGDMAKTGADGLGVDWSTSLADARRMAGEDVTLQGNIDPGVLYASPAEIKKAVQACLDSYGHGHRHILNLGHGVLQETPPDHVKAFVDAAHEFSPGYHV